MKKHTAAGSLLLCLSLLLSGCVFKPVDELYTLPKLAEDYQNLQAKIEEVTTGRGAEYSAPQFGVNTQPVQFQDLTGDGSLEAIAFFKVPTDEKPLKIYIFRQSGGGYELGAVVEGEGTAIYSVNYENLDGSPAKELVVSWQQSTNVNDLAVYSIARFEVAELLNTTYTGYELLDINMDNQRELMLISVDTVDGTKSRVDCYGSTQSGFAIMGSAPLSQGITGLDPDSVRKGNLQGSTPVPALFVTSYLGDGIVTDIFAWKDETIKNVTLSADTGLSGGTYRVKDKAKATDIDGDNVLELPIPVTQSAAGNAPTLDAWYQYDLNGEAKLVCTTYHNFTDNWYFLLPAEWVGRVSVSQDSMVDTEKRTTFGIWRGERSETFLTIYKLTGPNRHMRARLGERFTLFADDTTIYCAEFTAGGWDCGLDEAGVKEQFKISQTDWSAG